MSENNKNINLIDGGVAAPIGYEAAGVACGIKESGKPDVAVVFSSRECSAAAVFTSNEVVAPPVTVSMEQLKSGKTKAIVINSGNANACTGREGMENANKTVSAAATALSISPGDVLVASTGIIGKQLPMEKLLTGIEQATQAMSSSGGGSAAEAILTTDLVKKELAVSMETKFGDVKIGGMAKGSGMIEPNMKSIHATMIGVVTTDLVIESDELDFLLRNACDETFNMISVDGCQSTNDCVFALANGASQVKYSDILEEFAEAFKMVCRELAKMIVRDGEGATKVVAVSVVNAETKKKAQKIAKQIVNSDLVKTACFGNDPNWGRVLAAAGSVGVGFDQERAILKIQGTTIFKHGSPFEFNKMITANLMKAHEIEWVLDLGEGDSRATAWGCDLSYDYVRINAEYTT